MSSNKERKPKEEEEESDDEELVEREVKDDDESEEEVEEEKVETPKKKKKKSPAAEEEEEEGKAEEDGDLMFDPSKKKKKKKTKTGDDAEGGEEETEEDLMFNPNEKKGKKRKRPAGESTVEEETTASASATTDGGAPQGDGFSYQDLLKRVYDLIREKNPERLKDETGLPLPPAQVFLVGTKRTSWANFSDFCKLVKRPSDHVLAYTLSELATEGSLDGKGRLTVKGRFKPRQLEKVMRHYATEYVLCRSCKNPDTFLKKENRLFFLVCNSCGCSKSVANIQKGLPMIKKRSKNK